MGLRGAAACALAPGHGLRAATTAFAACAGRRKRLRSSVALLGRLGPLDCTSEIIGKPLSRRQGLCHIRTWTPETPSYRALNMLTALCTQNDAPTHASPRRHAGTRGASGKGFEGGARGCGNDAIDCKLHTVDLNMSANYSFSRDAASIATPASTAALAVGKHTNSSFLRRPQAAARGRGRGQEKW